MDFGGFGMVPSQNASGVGVNCLTVSDVGATIWGQS